MSIQDVGKDEIVPAHLDFLAIFNPDLGKTEETEKEQIVFYWSRPTRGRRKRQQEDAAKTLKEQNELENERMRQIGLAQGMVNFARTFVGDRDLDSVETQKHRIVLHQLEPGWWVLASVALTRVPVTPHSNSQSASSSQEVEYKYEYSSREVSPSNLLIQQLLRAERIFLLHHGDNLSDLYRRMRRTRFCGVLQKYWMRFAKTWNILLHGNPALEAFPATRLAPAGELGVGVGEEEWGSGEREVLEGIARETDGLVDLFVLRSAEQHLVRDQFSKGSTEADLPSSNELKSVPGVIFTGIGGVGKHSASVVTDWMHHISEFGSRAYGVQDNPASTRTKLQKPAIPKLAEPLTAGTGTMIAPSADADEEFFSAAKAPIPPSIMAVVEDSLEHATDSAGSTDRNGETLASKEELVNNYGLLTAAGWSKYLKLGYGTTWGRTNTQSNGTAERFAKPSQHAGNPDDHMDSDPLPPDRQGTFLVGLMGNLDELGRHESPHDSDTGTDDAWNSRILIRTLHVDVPSKEDTHGAQQSSNNIGSDSDLETATVPTSASSHTLKRVRVVVYQSGIFLYALLFAPETSTLSMPSFYHHLHKTLLRLRKPLETSTCSAKIHERLQNSAVHREGHPPDFDLIFDPAGQTVRSSIPNVPDIYETGSTLSHPGMQWTRPDAFNVFIQVLATLRDSKADVSLRELNTKTSRNWWIHWTRQRVALPLENRSSSDSYCIDRVCYKEVIVVRRADGRGNTQQGRQISIGNQLSLNTYGQKSGLGRFWSREDNEAGQDGSTSAKTSLWNASAISDSIDPRKYFDSLFAAQR